MTAVWVLGLILIFSVTLFLGFRKFEIIDIAIIIFILTLQYAIYFYSLKNRNCLKLIRQRECAFWMAAVSMLSDAEFETNDHREDASHFITYKSLVRGHYSSIEVQRDVESQ